MVGFLAEVLHCLRYWRFGLSSITNVDSYGFTRKNIFTNKIITWKRLLWYKANYPTKYMHMFSSQFIDALLKCSRKYISTYYKDDFTEKTQLQLTNSTTGWSKKTEQAWKIISWKILQWYLFSLKNQGHWPGPEYYPTWYRGSQTGWSWHKCHRFNCFCWLNLKIFCSVSAPPPLLL